MVDLNPLHYINKFNHMFGDTIASGLEFLGISDPAVDPDGIREIAKKWRHLATGLEGAAGAAGTAMTGVQWEGESAKAFNKRAKAARKQATDMAHALREGAKALDTFADKAHELLSEIGVILAEIAEYELAGLALDVLSLGASSVAATLMATERAAKVVALIGRIETEGTALASAVRGVMEVIRAVERALKALKEIRGVAAVAKMAKEGAKFSAFTTMLEDPGAFKDPEKLAGILAEGAVMGVGLGVLGKALGKGLKALKPGELAKLAKGLKLNCAAFERLKLNPGFDKLPASVRNMVKKFVRDPIDVATGDMALTRTDLTLPGVLPLVLERTHLSSYRHGGWFGPTWASTLDQRIQADDKGLVYATADGARLCFPIPDTETNTPVRPLTPGSRLTLTWDTDVDGAIRVTDPDTGLAHVFHSPVPAAGDTAVDLPLQHIEDRNGNRITIRYADGGGDIPTAVVHSGGYHIALDHHPTQPRITGLRLLDPAHPDRPGTTILTFGYDEHGHLTEEINSSGLPLRYTYDTEGRITSWTDRNNTTYWYAYDAHGRVIATGGTGNALASTLDYDATTRTTRVTDSLGHTRVYEHNEHLRLIRETDPLGNATTQEWDENVQLTALRDPLGRVTRYTYDEQGRVRTVVRPDGETTHCEYDPSGLPAQVTDPDGSRWTHEYDAHGRLVKSTDHNGLTKVFAHDGTGAVNCFTDPLGRDTRVRNNPAGLPMVVTDSCGATVTACERDIFGRPTVVTDAVGAVTHWEWTVEGKPIRRVAADGSHETWSYDGEGNCVQHTDANGGVSRVEYTHFDLMSARTGPDGMRLDFSYDSELRLIQVGNPQGLTWNYTYDAVGRLIAESDFDDRTCRYEHDAAGQLVQRLTPLGEVIRYDCDQLGRVTCKTAAGRITHFTYDAAGRVTRAATPETVLERTWDANGRLVSESLSVEGADARSISNAYDRLGRRTRRATPSGAVTTWDYDVTGRGVTLRTAGRTLRFEYDAVGREVTRRVGDNITFSSTYDRLGRIECQIVTGPQDQLIRERGYRYRGDGYLTHETLGNGRVKEFQLDAAGRVTGVQAQGWCERYAYDSAGNQTDASWPATHPVPEAQGARHYLGMQVIRAGGIRYEHDTAGRLVLRQKKRLSRKPETWRYNWDAEDRLTSVITPDGTEWRYRYDPLGRRIAKERLADDGTTVVERVDFAWDNATLCEQTSRGGAHTAPVTVTWDHSDGRPLAQTERMGVAHASQEQMDERFYAIVTDLIGTPTELVDEDGHIAWRMRSTLWGTTAWASDSTAYTPLRFPGQYFDPETGLHQNYFRYYDPDTGRYCSQDPLGLAPADNPFSYPHNPSTWSDPFGLAPQCGEVEPTPSNWVPDENYSPEAINDRIKGNADRKAWLETPQDVHDLVNELARNPNYPQRMTGPARARVPDVYRGGNSRAGRRWAGSPIYDNGDPFSQLRVMVDGNGNIAYFGRRADGSHNYDQVIPYPWAKRT
ncbi:DUF6531 domain-containing protein [Streptomyces sp. NPDC049915]|uniref:DUF6531 domain-containing protein n=1 Tax=Streptomyces sp. NPDC049915 TaxID=3155510 RepID=UPI00343AF162